MKLSSFVLDLLLIYLRTCRIFVEGSEIVEELINKKSRVIATTWHCGIIGGFCFLLKHPSNLSSYCIAMVSVSKDGQIANDIMVKAGFKTVRGSSGRGGIRAASVLIKHLNAIEDMPACAIVVADGSRGPAREVQRGIGFLAKHAKALILPIGVFAKPSIRLPSWDKMILPLPFSKIGISIGSPIDMNFADDEKLQRELKLILDSLYERAKLLVD